MSTRSDSPRPRYRGRFAPSPTGPLHFGSLVAALASYCDARAAGGQWLLRIEDVDPPRSRPGAESAILSTLERYGFAWDGEVTRQSERTDGYAAALERLRANAGTYECACSRRELESAAVGPGVDRVYPGTCRNGIPADRCDRPQRAWRVRVGGVIIEFDDRLQGPQAQDLAREVGDFVVRRADGLYAYQLAVVVDDALQAITHVVRGADLLGSTPRQIFLQRRLGSSPLSYLHVPVAAGAAGEKLSKQTGAAPLPDDPLPALVAAWLFLGQRPPEESSGPASPVDFWPWAIAAWDPARLPRDGRASLRPRRSRARHAERYNSWFPCGGFALRAPHLPRHRKRKPMTTLVAVRKNDEIAIAADSLTTFGDTRLSAEFDRTSEKIVHYKGTHIGLCGSAAHQLVFESLLAAHGDLDFSTKAAIFETFRKLHPILKEQHFLNPKEEEDDPYESTQVTALVGERARHLRRLLDARSVRVHPVLGRRIRPRVRARRDACGVSEAAHRRRRRPRGNRRGGHVRPQLRTSDDAVYGSAEAPGRMTPTLTPFAAPRGAHSALRAARRALQRTPR